MENKKTLFKTLELAALTREAERYVAERYAEQKMRCPTHLALGQEIVGAAFGALARPEDVFMGTYRSHGHYLSKGGDLFRLFAEMLGKAEGISGGLGGSMHLRDEQIGFYGSSAIVAATIPIATGVAYAQKLRRKTGVTVIFFGDAALEEGIVTESVNFAMLYHLPIVFVCENNRLCVTTTLDVRTVRDDLFRRFEPYGLYGRRVDGRDVGALGQFTLDALDAARAGAGPQFVEVLVDRWATHVGHEFVGPVDAWWQDPKSPAADACPLAQLARQMLDNGVCELRDLTALHERLRAQVVAEFARAEALLDPLPADELSAKVYASGLRSTLPGGAVVTTNAARDAYVEAHKLVNPF